MFTHFDRIHEHDGQIASQNCMVAQAALTPSIARKKNNKNSITYKTLFIIFKITIFCLHVVQMTTSCKICSSSPTLEDWLHKQRFIKLTRKERQTSHKLTACLEDLPAAFISLSCFSCLSYAFIWRTFSWEYIFLNVARKWKQQVV